MLNKIRLSHFRQHIDREWVFGSGMNAVRGENEAGKTTLLEAFFYFCFGVRALREPLEDVVTYHHSASKLRVDVEMTYLGVTYTGYRGKSGAEVSFGREKVVGQSEVTKFFEKLFGADAKMAGKLMFASQKALAESLKAGPTDAGKMIEDLANFDAIEDVIAAIQARRPTGVTSAVEGRIAALRGQLEQGEVLQDLMPIRSSIEVAEGQVKSAQTEVQRVQAQLDELDLVQARQILADDDRLLQTINRTRTEIDQLEAKLSAPAPTAPTDAEIAAARQHVEDFKQSKRASAASTELLGLDVSELWDKDAASLDAEIAVTEAKLADHRDNLTHQRASLVQANTALAKTQADHRVEITRLEGRLIKETTCALCQKDLSEVPEVVKVNLDLTRQIDAARAKSAEIETQLAADATLIEGQVARVEALLNQCEEYLRALRAVKATNDRIEQVYARHADYIQVDRSVVPGTWTWTGPELRLFESDGVAALTQLERQRDAALGASAARAEWKQRLGQLLDEIEAAAASRQSLADMRAEAVETLELEGASKLELQKAQSALRTAESGLQTWRQELATQLAVQEQQQKARDLAKQQLAAAEQELVDMQRYNALIKKVRAARPVITDKLWNIVLAGASKHFSAARGMPSVISRSDSMFKCNGYPVSGLSGSAEDMLGLALRISLTKTFLPGADFLHLDEPAAACSDARETRMLGMLSTLGFGQIILITHSDLADSFADRIINV